jgi:hypothetical protein
MPELPEENIVPEENSFLLCKKESSKLHGYFNLSPDQLKLALLDDFKKEVKNTNVLKYFEGTSFNNEMINILKEDIIDVEPTDSMLYISVYPKFVLVYGNTIDNHNLSEAVWNEDLGVYVFYDKEKGLELNDDIQLKTSTTYFFC